ADLERLVAGDPPAAPAASPKDARFRMYATVSAVLRTAAAARPLVLVIDDLQWADEGSVALLARVAEDLERMRVLVLATYRDRRLADPLESAIARLARNPHAELVPLSGLERDDVGELLERTAAVRSPSLAAALAAHTLGNPFFVGEVVRMLVAEGRMERAGRHPRQALESVPSTVRHVVGHRLGAVSPGAREVLEAAAVRGTEFDADVVARALGRPAIDVGEALEAAAAAHLVREDAARGGAWSFAHGIVRQAVYERVSRTRRGRLHAAVAAALEERRAGAADDVGDLAHHYGVAAAIGLDTHAPAVRYSRQAAERAIGLLAYDVAVEHLERAERLLGTMGDGAVAEHCDVLLALAQARAAAGDLPQAKRDSVTAARLARAAGDTQRLAQAARRRAEWATYGIVDHEAVALLRDALARLPEADGEDRAHLLALLAARLDPAEAQPQRERLIAEALAIARRRGDREALPLLLLRSAYINFGCDRAAFRAAATDEAIAIGGDDDEYAMRAHVLRFADALAAGAPAVADAELERYAAIARRLKLPYYDWYGLILRATREAFRGDAAAAERLAEAARASIGAQEDDSDQEWVVQRLMVARLRGRLADARAEPLQANAERYPDLLMWRAMASWLDAETGRRDRAAGAVSAELLARLDRVQRDEDRLTVLFFLGDTVATLGDRYAAQRLLPLLAAEAARNVVTDRGW
ncbi:MAG TPA: AAA family ATPase, partial [Solirubrobacteraceae bacterium]|nr:AAA family ATPase [Solirubrobacteraceae bacterium]